MAEPRLPRLLAHAPDAAVGPGEVEACGCHDTLPAVVPAVRAEPVAHPEKAAREGGRPVDDGAGLWLEVEPGEPP